MERCLQLARLGAGYVAPNPMVGAVLVYKDLIIGEGYHQSYGEPHAEVNCLASVTEINRPFIPHSTLYVSLEPCAHFGKTPPCADLVIKNQISKVVIACRDSFEKVNGRGIERLQEAGIQVIEGVLEKEALELNKRFFCFHKNRRPYIYLKWAQTADGFIAGSNSQALKISNDLSNRWVHRLRSSEAAIMVGTNTALQDNPSLTTRLWHGLNPVRVVIDKLLKIPRSSALLDDSSQLIILNFVKEEIAGHIHYVKLQPDENILVKLMRVLFEKAINSLIVEGGTVLLKSFLDAGLWDEAVIITNSSLNIREGIRAPSLTTGVLMQKIHYGNDIIRVFKNIEQ